MKCLANTRRSGDFRAAGSLVVAGACVLAGLCIPFALANFRYFHAIIGAGIGFSTLGFLLSISMKCAGRYFSLVLVCVLVAMLVWQASGNAIARGRADLHTAVRWFGDPKLVRSKIAQGYDINARDQEGRTPLMGVFPRVILRDEDPWEETRVITIINILLQNGADVNLTDDYGRSVLHYAVSGMYSYPRAVRVLLKSGANVNIKDNVGDTPLHLLAKRACWPEMAQVLLKNGADPTIRNDHGMTPLQLAQQHGCPEVVKVIRSWDHTKNKSPAGLGSKL